MSTASKPTAAPLGGGTSEFLPKSITVLREGYGLSQLRADALAGLTVAIVALPLSMAIAIASGLGPERGLYTTIIGGFLVSALGGSRFQIGGPAGAFIVLVSACVMATGVQGLILATFLSGFILAAAGLLRLGNYIRFIPYPVTVGFTAGIAVIIFASQIRDLFGLHLAGGEPAELFDKLATLWAARATVTPAAFAVALGVIAAIQGLKSLRPHWPGMLIAVAGAALVTGVAGLPIETIGSKFGELPRVPPAPALPPFDLASLQQALPWAASFAMLGAIESLLSAVVADGMSGRRHRSNAELLAQGIANIGAALFGGFCVTGTIARTATNVRAGSQGPVSGMLHALFVLAFMLIAAPLAAFIPLAALAGVLAIVAWNMAERHEFWHLIRQSRADAMVLLVTFLLVIFRDLTEGIVAGFALGGLVFITRMADAGELQTGETPFATDDQDRVICKLSGPWFFGTAARLGSALEQIADLPREFVIDLSDVPMIDASGARSFQQLAGRLSRRGAGLVIVGARPAARDILIKQGVKARYVADMAALNAGRDGAQG